MKVVILAGGFGTRLSEETTVRPKPMVEVGDKPIICHIMNHYAYYGLNEFVICCGYKGEYIKDFFLNYHRNQSDFTIDLKSGDVSWIRNRAEDWKVTLLDTGLDTMTGGRIKRAQEVIGDEAFCLTYGDGVTDLNIRRLIDFHRRNQAWATLTAVSPPGRFGALHVSKLGYVEAFREKAARDGGLINGGFFVCEPEVFDLIEDDSTVWEQDPMARLVELNKLAAYHHDGFWQSMDSLRDKMVLQQLWDSGNPPWLQYPDADAAQTA